MTTRLIDLGVGVGKIVDENDCVALHLFNPVMQTHSVFGNDAISTLRDALNEAFPVQPTKPSGRIEVTQEMVDRFTETYKPPTWWEKDVRAMLEYVLGEGK